MDMDNAYEVAAEITQAIRGTLGAGLLTTDPEEWHEDAVFYVTAPGGAQYEITVKAQKS
jgi:hypothetical protein